MLKSMAVLNIAIDMPKGLTETEMTLVACLSADDRYIGLTVRSNLLPFLLKHKLLKAISHSRKNLIQINGLTEDGEKLAALISYSKL